MGSIVVSTELLENFRNLLDRALGTHRDVPATSSAERRITSVEDLGVDWAQDGDDLDGGMELDAVAEATAMISVLPDMIPPVGSGWVASIGEEEIRRRGVEFLDQSIPGYALMLGRNADPQEVVKLIRELVEKGIYVFVAGEGLSTLLRESELALGWEGHVLLMGPAPIDLLRALGILTRIAQSFNTSNHFAEVLQSMRTRLPGFTILLGEPGSEELAIALAALSYGCPLLSEKSLPPLVEGWDPEEKGYRAAIAPLKVSAMAQAGIEERNMRVRIAPPLLPIEYSTDYAGEVVRGEAVGADLRGAELVVMNQDIQDGRVSIIGPDLDASFQERSPFALLVEVAGRAMQPDYESVLEREIEGMLNEAHGIMHRGQRTDTSLRIERGAIKKGLRLGHLGEILHARFHNEFGSIVSRVQVTIFTDEAKALAAIRDAQTIYERRDARLKDLKDETVDTLYSCSLCQSIAANHVCVISPEHPGACGAQDWLTTQAAVSIRPVGPYRSIQKEGLIDPQRGQWESVNAVVHQESHGTIDAYNLYSLVEAPATACGDFDCVTVMLPSLNGVMVVGRDYSGPTPSGMDFATLQEIVGIGEQAPGFLGHSKRLLTSRKFISGDGGWRRIVWMNRSLREEIRSDLDEEAAAEGEPGFVDKIATESEGLEEAQIQAWLESVRHPVLAMDPLL